MEPPDPLLYLVLVSLVPGPAMEPPDPLLLGQDPAWSHPALQTLGVSEYQEMIYKLSKSSLLLILKLENLVNK